MNALLQQIRRTIQRHALCPPGSPCARRRVGRLRLGGADARAAGAGAHVGLQRRRARALQPSAAARRPPATRRSAAISPARSSLPFVGRRRRRRRVRRRRSGCRSRTPRAGSATPSSSAPRRHAGADLRRGRPHARRSGRDGAPEADARCRPQRAWRRLSTQGRGDPAAARRVARRAARVAGVARPAVGRGRNQCGSEQSAQPRPASGAAGAGRGLRRSDPRRRLRARPSWPAKTVSGSTSWPARRYRVARHELVRIACNWTRRRSLAEPLPLLRRVLLAGHARPQRRPGSGAGARRAGAGRPPGLRPSCRCARQPVGTSGRGT